MTKKDVEENGWILPEKKKYTMRDFKKLYPQHSAKIARFIIICSAVHWYFKQEAAGVPYEERSDYSRIFDDLQHFNIMDYLNGTGGNY